MKSFEIISGSAYKVVSEAELVAMRDNGDCHEDTRHNAERALLLGIGESLELNHVTIARIQDDTPPVTAFLCGPRRSKRTCPFCGERTPNGRLCDFKTGDRQTCDAFMCPKCAKRVGRNRDLCPTHAKVEAAQQRAIGGAR